MKSLLRLTEHEPRGGVRLSSAQAALLSASRLVTVVPTDDGTWRVNADKEMVGAVRLSTRSESVDLVIAPKLPVRRLFFLLGHSQQGLKWYREAVDTEEHTDLLPAVAHAFARMSERALGQGVLMGYRTVEESSSVLRGRVRTADQVRHHFGMLLPVEIRYDDHTRDIAENQILLFAARRLGGMPGTTTATSALLRRVVARLDGVSLLAPGRSLPHWRATRLNTRYHDPLHLAELLLNSGSYEFGKAQTLRADGLVLRMWQVFESFVTRTLTNTLRPGGGRCLVQDERFSLDHAGMVRLRPDLVYQPSGASGPTGVVDVKYKWARAQGGHTGDLYQMLAYCTRFGLGEGHLVYAAGPGAIPGRHHLHGSPGVTVYQHVLDLDTEPEDLLSQVEAIATAIRRTG